MDISTRFRKKDSVISAQDWQKIENNAKWADQILTSSKFGFLMDYLQSSQEEIKNMILTNRIKEVHEEYTISESLKKIFVIPKKVQVDELVGKYAFINQFIEYLHFLVQLKKDAEKAQSEKKVIIESSHET